MPLSDDVVRVDLPGCDDPVLRRAFLDGMSRVASSVTIVTTEGAAGRFGQTVSAMVSVTADPPTLMVCLFRDTPVAEAVRANGCLAVNVLSASDRGAAADFAGQTDHSARYKFDEGWTSLQTGSPIRSGAPAVFDCHAEKFLSLGTHLAVVGRVVAARHGEGACLTYADRAFGTSAPLDS